MGRISVVFVERDGSEVTVEGEAGHSLMEAATAHGVDGIIGECGGNCACATCHVYVDPAWRERLGAPEFLEEMTLEGVSHILRDNSRLGCQIILDESMDGLRVAVAPPQ